MFLHNSFNSAKDVVQNRLSLNTVTMQRSGIITLKLLVHRVTEVDRELPVNVEQELHNIRLKHYEHDFSKVVSIIRKLVNALAINGITNRSLTVDWIHASHDNSFFEDHGMDVIF